MLSLNRMEGVCTGCYLCGSDSVSAWIRCHRVKMMAGGGGGAGWKWGSVFWTRDDKVVIVTCRWSVQWTFSGSWYDPFDNVLILMIMSLLLLLSCVPSGAVMESIYSHGQYSDHRLAWRIECCALRVCSPMFSTGRRLERLFSRKLSSIHVFKLCVGRYLLYVRLFVFCREHVWGMFFEGRVFMEGSRKSPHITIMLSISIYLSI
jgi:hypothetical protein